MKNHLANITERRQRPRVGVMAEIENLTYSALRRYGITGPTEPPSPGSLAEKAA